MLKSFLNSAFAFWIGEKIYKFVSYNRGVISPSISRPSVLSTDRSFHPKYRLIYLIFTWLITASVLYIYSYKLMPWLATSNFYREFVACGGQIIWQLLIIRLLYKRRAWDYLGNMMTISLAGALVLALLILLGTATGIENPLFYGFAFLCVVGLMLLEHLRRCRILGYGWGLTASWVTYRIALLLFIL